MFNVIGPILGRQGYSINVRGLANALSKITDVRLTTNLIPGWESQVNDKELEMIKKKVEKDEINGFKVENITKKGVALKRAGKSWFIPAPEVKFSVDKMANKK